MSKFTIQAIEARKEDWKVANLRNDTGRVFENVSINKTDKNGLPFPNFDTLANGQEIEGEYWESSAGRSYLYPPKEVPAPIISLTLEERVKRLEDLVNRGLEDHNERLKALEPQPERPVGAKVAGTDIVYPTPASEGLDENDLANFEPRGYASKDEPETEAPDDREINPGDIPF